jgi:hypothetical protein
MLNTISLDYIINVLKETPDQFKIKEIADLLISGELEIPYADEVVRTGDKVNTEQFLKQLNLIAYRKTLVDTIAYQLGLEKDQFKLATDLFSHSIELEQTSRPYTNFLWMMTPEDVVQSNNMQVSDCLTLLKRNETVIKELRVGETFSYNPANYLKVIKQKEDLDGFSVAITANKQTYGMRFANTTKISYCNLPDFKLPQAQIKPDSDSKCYLVNARFADPGWAEFKIPYQVYNQIDSCYIDTNMTKSSCEITFLTRDGTEQTVGRISQSDGMIQDKQEVNQTVIAKVRLLSLSETIVPAIKFIGLYKERYKNFVRIRIPTQFSTTED